MNEVSIQDESSVEAFRRVRSLVGSYVILSVLTLGAIVMMRGRSDIVDTAVWVRGSIVAGSALVTFAIAERAARGSRGAYKRLRIISAAMLTAIAVIVSLPGAFPVWLRVEQGVCGLLLAGVVVIVNGRHLRSVFAA